MCTTLINCIRGLGQVTLYITNFIFMCLSIGLIAVGSYVMRSDWKDFFKTEFVWVIIGAGVFMLFISCLGCAGARTKKKRYLCPYSTVVFLMLCAQLAGAALALNFKGSMDKAKSEGFDEKSFDSATESAYNYIKGQWETTFTAGKCSITSAPGVFPFTTECTNEDAGFLQKFMNQKCQNEATFNKCEKEGNANYALTFCNCQGALVTVLTDKLGPISTIAIVAAVFEFFLVFASCLLMCDDRKKENEAAQARTQPLASNAYGQPVGQPIAHHQAAVGANPPNMV